MGVIMRRLFVALTSAVSVVALTHMASAADLGARVVYKAQPLPPPVQDWSGVYVGLEGGYGWGRQTFEPAFDPFFFDEFGGEDDPTIGSVNQKGWLFGGFAGAQKQWGNWVLGIEADFDGADIKGSSTASSSQFSSTGGEFPTTTTVNKNQTIDSKIDELGSVRGKVGFAAWQNWLFYGTGGLAWAHKKDDASQSQTNTFCDPLCFDKGDFSATESGGLSMFGWAAGGGIDYKWQIDPGSAVIFGVQYLHYGFGSNTLTLADNQFGSGSSFAINTKESVDTIKGRISYLFSIH